MIQLMRLMIFVPTIFLLFGASRAQTPQRDHRPRTASISGRVTVGGKSAANAKVVVAEVKARTGLGNSDVSLAFGGMGDGEEYNALTDADGSYRVTGLPEGNYEVRVMLKAYIAEKKSGDNDLVRDISLGEGEAVDSVDFSLVRGGVITGRVTDADSRPMISHRVQLQFVDENGQKHDHQINPTSQMFETDDRGVYRLYGLRAGRYLVSVGGEGVEFFGSGGGNYPRTWHPDVADQNQAKVIEIREGGEATGVDIKFGSAKKTFEASGRVIDEATGRPIPKVSLMCLKTGGDGGGGGGYSGMVTTDAQGNFRLNGLTPGHYQIFMYNPMAILGGGENSHYADQTAFEVKSDEVENVEVKAKTGAAISGVAVIEGLNDASAKTILGQTGITAQSKQEPAGGPLAVGSALNLPVMIKTDGSFRITGIRPGKVKFEVLNIGGKSLSLSRIERDGVDAGDGIEVRAGENIVGIRLVLSQGTGVIRGQVNVVNGKLPEGWRMQVSARSDKSAGESSGYAVVDGKGRFVLEGLMPGQYSLTLTAMVAPGSGVSTDYEFPSPVTQPVTVANGAEVQVTLTLDLKKKDQEDRQ